MKILDKMTGFWMEGINLLILSEFKVPNYWKSECFFIIIIYFKLLLLFAIIIIIITSNTGKSKL